jgi:hypothetical protein
MASLSCSQPTTWILPVIDSNSRGERLARAQRAQRWSKSGNAKAKNSGPPVWVVWVAGSGRMTTPTPTPTSIGVGRRDGTLADRSHPGYRNLCCMSWPRVGEYWIGGVGTAHVISLHPSTSLTVWGFARVPDSPPATSHRQAQYHHHHCRQLAPAASPAHHTQHHPHTTRSITRTPHAASPAHHTQHHNSQS